ncbi:MAG: ATP-binding protein [Leptospiraceae bacterium]|nr:ATP-binding protein [Leptospiraceae bacterium]
MNKYLVNDFQLNKDIVNNYPFIFGPVCIFITLIGTITSPNPLITFSLGIFYIITNAVWDKNTVKFEKTIQFNLSALRFLMNLLIIYCSCQFINSPEYYRLNLLLFFIPDLIGNSLTFLKNIPYLLSSFFSLSLFIFIVGLNNITPILLIGICFMTLIAYFSRLIFVFMNKKLLEAEELSKVKSQFLANMSHEIRTPLNAIYGFADLLQMETEENSIQQTYTNHILTSSNHLMNIINQILDFSKIQSGAEEIQISNSDLLLIAEEVMNGFETQASRKKLELKLDFPKDIPSLVKVDGFRLRQILYNLTGNAIKFTESGFVFIRIKASPSSRKNHYDYTFEIEDTGIGIPEDKESVLFQEFSQVDMSNQRKFGGTGLGLSISQNLAKLMGGKIRYQRSERNGSIFSLKIELEVLPQETTQTEKTQTSTSEENSQNKKNPHKILIVDDNKLNIDLLKAFLKRIDVVPDSAMSATEAMQKIQNNSYSVFFLDIEMPEVSGMDLLTQLKSEPKYSNLNYSTIACTAHAMEGSREEYINFGFDYYLAKPYKLEQIQEILAQISKVKN